MPTLIRLIVILLVLVGIGYGAMFALVVFVEPNQKEVTIRIPARDLLPAPDRDPLVLREIDTSRTVEAPPPEATPEDAADQAADQAAEPAPDESAGPTEEGSIVTLAPGIE